MKLLINTATTLKGGGIQVAKSLIEECKKFNEHTYYVILGNALAKLIETDTFPDNFYFYKIHYRPATRIFSLKSRTDFFEKIEKSICPDMVFTTSGPAYWRPKAPHLVGFNIPHHIYPESPYFSKISRYRRLRWAGRKTITKYFFQNDSDAFVVQTDDVNHRLRDLFKIKAVYTVPNTCSAYYYDPKQFPNKLPKNNGDEYRLLTLSAWYLHKNLDIIPCVIDSLPEKIRQRVRFVLTLPKMVFEKEFPIKIRRYIENVGPLSVKEGPSLYKECDALFLPTLLECFSASYPEAMAMGKPILTSDMGFARSICKDAALYFDPMDPKDIAVKINALVKSKKIQNELVEKGKNRLQSFCSAQSRAEKYLQLCEQIRSKPCNENI